MASYRELDSKLKLLTLFEVRERLQNLASTSLLVSFSVCKRNRCKHIQRKYVTANITAEENGNTKVPKF